jgi:hypothetical protein
MNFAMAASHNSFCTQTNLFHDCSMIGGKVKKSSVFCHFHNVVGSLIKEKLVSILNPFCDALLQHPPLCSSSVSHKCTSCRGRAGEGGVCSWGGVLCAQVPL